MEKIHRYHHNYYLIFSVAFILSLLSFAFCFVAEFKKSKEEDVKLDGRLCQLPRSEAFGFGIAALVCSSMAQIIGNLIFFMGFWPGSSGERRSCCQAHKQTIASILLVISWLSFGMALILISTATSMNRRQLYGKGWVNGECYLVKDGIFISASILVLLSFGCTLASAVPTMRKKLQQVSADEKRPSQKSGCPTGIK